MEEKTKIACLEEISHLILDENKKISIKRISNDWDLPVKSVSEILDEWVNTFGQGKKFSKEFLVKGCDENGNAIITIVPEAKLNPLLARMTISSSFLFSIEIPSESCKKINTPIYTECKKINIVLNAEERSSGSPVKPIAKVEEKKKNVSSMFPLDVKKKPSIEKEIEKPIKIEKSTPKKEINKTPKKGPTPNKRESPRKRDNKKEIPKKSIASFFSAPSKKTGASVSTTSSITTSTVVSNKNNSKPSSTNGKTEELNVSPQATLNKSESLKKPNSTEKIELSLSESSKTKQIKNFASQKEKTITECLKQSISVINGDSSSEDDYIVQPTQKQKSSKSNSRKRTKNTSKQENGNAKKRSRIVQNSASSSDNENEEEIPNEAQKSPENKNTDNPSFNVKKNKAKRVVSKTYEDKDGFITTVKEIEEYSCSDEEVAVVEKEEPKNIKQEQLKLKKIESAKKVVASKPATKQGSIMSFFTKK